MAMTILNNSAANMTLGELNKNTNKVGKQLTKIATGQRITGASDDSASFAISEKMRDQIRSLEQDIQNVQNGSSMLKTAHGGIENIVEELRSLKELAIDAANDSNTDADRQIMQKEFDQRRATIDEIATWTNYNGKALLDGTYYNITNIRSSTIHHNGNSTGGTMPTGPEKPVNPGDGGGDGFHITADGVYILQPGVNFPLVIEASAKNVVVRQADPSTPLNNVSIIKKADDGDSNFWIDSLNIVNTKPGSIIKYENGSINNNLIIVGENTLTAPSSSSNDAAVVNVGDGGLSIRGYDSSAKLTVKSASGSGSFEETSSGGKGAGIGTDGGELSLANIAISNLDLDITVYDGAGIGSGGNGTIGNIVIKDCTINAHGHYNANIGTGHPSGSCGDISVISSTFTSHNIDTGIGSAYSGSTCGNILIKNSTMEITNSLSACIGAGDASECGNINVYSSSITGSSTVGACIGSGQGGSTAKDITVTGNSTIKHTSTDGAAIGSGKGGHVGSIKISAASLAGLDATEAYSDETHKYPGIGRGRNGTAGSVGDVDVIPEPGDEPPDPTPDPGWDETITRKETDFNPLWIQHGTKANQRINVYIRDMHTRSLKIKIPDDNDRIILKKLNDDPTKSDEAKEYYNIITEARKSNLDLVNVKTRYNAKVSLRIVDSAIEYALDEATTVGAYLQRLEYTGSNIITTEENTQGAESTIRDADMAKEMTEYTKNNVLSQAAQSMLAQANQNLSSVLSLLQ